MIFYKRILGFVLALIFPILIEISYYYPKFFNYGLVLSLLLLVFYFWKIKNRFIKNTEILSYFGICLVFLASLWCFFVVCSNLIIRVVISVLSVYFFIVLFDSIFKKIYENREITSDIIKNIDLLCFLFYTFFV